QRATAPPSRWTPTRRSRAKRTIDGWSSRRRDRKQRRESFSKRLPALFLHNRQVLLNLREERAQLEFRARVELHELEAGEIELQAADLFLRDAVRALGEHRQ